MVARPEVGVAVGNIVEISGRRVGDAGRLGEIVAVLGAAEHPHFRVRWEDGRESIYYPGEGTRLRRREDGTRRG